MKKPKIKPDIIWMAKRSDGRLVVTYASVWRWHCWHLICTAKCASKSNLKKQGWHIVKVRISEVK